MPNGLILEHPENPNKTVELKGLNNTTIIGATYAHNEVEEDFWNAWEKVNKDFAPYKNGSIFVAKSTDAAQSKSKELEKETTGFEPMAQEDDKRAKGVKKAK